MSPLPQETTNLTPLRRRLLDWFRDALHAQETGGLSWHWSAFRARHAWEPTQRAIETFLLSEPPKATELLLIGGSAGWMMSSAWLAQFKTITVIDIDPLASLFFRLLHGKALQQSGTKWSFKRVDALTQLPLLLKEHPQALVFFDNVLGQQCFRLKDEERVERLIRHIKVALKGRSWGSIHDVYSGPIDLNTTPTPTQTPPKTPTATSLITPLITPQHLRTFTCQFGKMVHEADESLGQQSKEGSGEHRKSNSASASDSDSEFDLKPEHMVINGERKSFDEGAQILLQAVNAAGEWKDHLSIEVFAPDTPSIMIPWFFKDNYCHWLQMSMVFE